MDRQYELPTGGTAGVVRDWRGRFEKGFIPTERQTLLMLAVAAAHQQGHLFLDQLVSAVASALRISADVIGYVEGDLDTPSTALSLDCFFARQALLNIAERRVQRRDYQRLRPFSGKPLGRVSFEDQTLTGTRVTAVDLERMLIHIAGQRGKSSVNREASPTELVSAVERGRKPSKRGASIPRILSLSAFTAPGAFGQGCRETGHAGSYRIGHAAEDQP